jgi:hypothetical protein
MPTALTRFIVGIIHTNALLQIERACTQLIVLVFDKICNKANVIKNPHCTQMLLLPNAVLPNERTHSKRRRQGSLLKEAGLSLKRGN